MLVLVKWVPQSASSGGQLLAVDGQPDGSVGRKRFWEGTFLFAAGEKSAGPGWKAFRPLVAAGEGGRACAAEQFTAGQGGEAGFARFSDEQGKTSADAFYARMSKLSTRGGCRRRWPTRRRWRRWWSSWRRAWGRWTTARST